MIHETCHIASISGINDFIIANPHQVGTGTVTVLLNLLTAEPRMSAEHFSYILHDERSFTDVLACKQPPAFTSTVKRVDVTVVLVLESPILTTVTYWTGHGITFNTHHPV